MFSKSNIVFEKDIFSDKASTIDKETIINSIYELAVKEISTLGIISLEKIIIGKVDLFEKTLGSARINCGKSEIKLSRKTAVELVNKNDSSRYKNAFATFKHEFYHVYDYEHILVNLLKNSVGGFTKEQDGFDMWTEFFAAYSTFDIHEQDNIYESFEYVFKNDADNTKQKKYYTCQLLGYYMHNNHASVCDDLIRKYLNELCIKKISNLLNSLIAIYPNISLENLIDLHKLIEDVILPKTNLDNYIPVDINDIWKSFQRRK